MTDRMILTLETGPVVIKLRTDKAPKHIAENQGARRRGLL